MSLNKKFNKIDGKGEEKKINLRMSKGKAEILEILAEHYEINISTLIREMIDNSLIQLQKELVLVKEGLSVKVTNSHGEEEIRYLPDIIEILAPSIYFDYFPKDDFKSPEEYDNFIIEHNRLSVEYGLSEEIHGTSPISKKEYEFKKNRKKD